MSSSELSRRSFLSLCAACGVFGTGAPYLNRWMDHSVSIRDSLRKNKSLGEKQKIKIDDYSVSTFPESVPKSISKRPNIILIVLDTVRADHLSCYGYDRMTTPNIDQFAKTGKLFENVLSPSGWTAPSHASLFTGLPQSAHGVQKDFQFLDEKYDTMAEILTRSGYDSLGLTTNPNAGKLINLLAGFKQNKEFFDQGWFGKNSPVMQTYLANWFRDQYNPQKPFFVFMNYIDAHWPYIPAEMSQFINKQRVDFLSKQNALEEISQLDYFVPAAGLNSEHLDILLDLYDEEIYHLDRLLGHLFTFLDRTGMLENTMVVVTSDHGEMFNEHGFIGHERLLYEAIVRVPMILHYPKKVSAGVEKSLVQTHDLFATVMDVAGID